MQLLDGQDTPLMRQYLEIKDKCKDAILLYRLGDFYEMFFDDAVKASKILDIALTSRDKGAKNPIPLCGVPHHSSKNYISKLLDAGQKVAICEQVESPAAAKGIVKREIVKIISKGTRSDEEGLASHQSNLMLSIFVQGNHYGVSWIDVSSGAVETTSFDQVEELKNFILSLSPSEIVVPNDAKLAEQLSFLEGDFFEHFHVEKIFPWIYEQAQKEILKRFQVSHLESLGIEDVQGSAESIFGLIHYIEEKNQTKIPHIQTPRRYLSKNYVHLDHVTQENLELFESRKNQTMGSLFSVLNQTKTSMGARELRAWIQKPLQNLVAIRERLALVDTFFKDSELRSSIRKQLGAITDVERILRRVATQTSTVSDLVSLKMTLQQVPLLRNIFGQKNPALLEKVYSNLLPHTQISELLEKSIDNNASLQIANGGFIRPGFNQELDRLRSLSSQNQEWLAKLEGEERKKTGISSLKISYNRVFGYYIEITKTHHDKVPSHYIRKQTLVSAERYITPELKEKEEEIQSSKERMIAMELQILQSIREQIAQHVPTLQLLCETIATLDVHTSLADVAVQYGYVKPDVNDGFSLSIVNGRHPVVERSLKGEPFIPNDVSFTDDSRMILLTGPNMAGKSTVMRQTALIILMAQIGSFVPADQAVITVIDRIFTRIGASDDLAGGRSTFMVEMNETAQILLNATERSFILLDEIGRGTSTYDGLSIAWAVAEDIDARVRAKTIFATHYHELTQLSAERPHITNMRMAIREWNDKIVFLRKMESGETQRSYGIEVASLAGVRDDVIIRSKQILKQLESDKLTSKVSASTVATTQISHPALDELQELNIDDFSSKQALDYLYQLKQRIKS